MARIKKGVVLAKAKEIGVNPQSLYILYYQKRIKDINKIGKKWFWRYNYGYIFTKNLADRIVEYLLDREINLHQVILWVVRNKLKISKSKEQTIINSWYNHFCNCSSYKIVYFRKLSDKKDKYLRYTVRYFKRYILEVLEEDKGIYISLMNEVKSKRYKRFS